MREQIIQAAQQLFQTHGVEKVTMDDVAREIGKGRSSLYYYYKNKDEILDAAIDVEMKEILQEIIQAVSKVDSFSEKINTYYITRLKITLKRRMFNKVVDNELKTLQHKRFRQIEIPLLQQILTVGISQGILRKMDKKEQETLIFILLSSLQGFKKEMLLKKNISTIEPAIKMLTNLIIQGFKV
jgi:AcrR family transcriptional regulator